MSKSHITEPEIQIESDDVVYLMYTSGTTGLPKGVMLSHKGQIENAKALLMEQALVRDDTHLAIMPLYHVGGRALPLSHTLRSCTVFIRDKFDPKQFLEDVEHYRITTTQLVPTMISFILEVPEVKKYDMGSLRTVWYASSPMPLALLKKTLEVFGDTLIQGYGLTEAGPLVTALHKEDHQIGDEASEGRLQSAGFPAIGVTVRIVDNNMNDVPVGELGEIAVKSDFIMKGYWKMDEETNKTLKNGWLLTGDIGKLDERGYIYVVDRKKDVIISGGENIYPREVEEILYQHPAVLEAAVIGVPDEVWGENVMAVIVLKEGARTTEDEIIQFCKERLASYKKPKIVKFIDNLPKNPSGKILKYELRKRYAEKN
jgi:acyl-CoA synthetase (AMP-forming)/AMP-acid ligase II